FRSGKVAVVSTSQGKCTWMVSGTSGISGNWLKMNSEGIGLLLCSVPELTNTTSLSMTVTESFNKAFWHVKYRPGLNPRGTIQMAEKHFTKFLRLFNWFRYLQIPG